MRVGIIDLDKTGFPNLPLMKLSAYHKAIGDSVEWYEPLFGWYDRVYISKIFTSSPDYLYPINATEVIRGGSGYCINIVDGKEVYDVGKDSCLPPVIEHIYPDYSIYGIEDTAYGFLTRGCPRGCSFCHVKDKEGCKSYKVAELSEFWNGQKNIVLCDPNILAYSGCMELLEELEKTNSYIDFNQGLDIRLMTKDKAEFFKKGRIKTKNIHFAWDRYEDKDIILPKFKMFKEICGKNERQLVVYVLCNYDTKIEQDLERVYTLREMGYWAYIMLYNKDSLPKGHTLRKMQRWVNNRYIFGACKTFDEYLNR